MASLTPRCGFCSSNKKLLRCGKCKVMLYCGKEHQEADRANHKSACNAIKETQDRYDREEQALRANPGDRFMSADVFTNDVGRFWDIRGTRDYMRARYALVESTLRAKTFDAVNSALDHAMDMLRLSRSDDMGVQDHVPAMLLRLGRDQKCYDFVKWYRTTGQEVDYHGGYMSLPFLDVVGANVFEPVEYLCDAAFLDLSPISAIALLKIKLMLDLKGLRNSSALKEKVPSEIVDNIRRHVPQSPIISENKDTMNRADHTSDIETLSTQVDQLYVAIEKANMYWWDLLLYREEHVYARPQYSSQDSLEQAQLALKYSLDAWEETPGALEVIRNLEGKFRGQDMTSSSVGLPFLYQTRSPFAC